jgi:hypothetical protein
MMKKILAVAATSMIFLLSGCGDMYKTHYWYKGPASQEGRHCVKECWEKHHQCRKWAEGQHMNRHEMNRTCTEKFNECYKSCGGEVFATQSKWEEGHWNTCKEGKKCHHKKHHLEHAKKAEK